MTRLHRGQGKRKREDSSSDDENEPVVKKARLALENQEARIEPANAALQPNVAIVTNDSLPVGENTEHPTNGPSVNLNGKAFHFNDSDDDLLCQTITMKHSLAFTAELEYVKKHDGGSIDIGSSDSEDEDDDAFIDATNSIPSDDANYIPPVGDGQGDDEQEADDEYSTEDE